MNPLLKLKLLKLIKADTDLDPKFKYVAVDYVGDYGKVFVYTEKPKIYVEDKRHGRNRCIWQLATSAFGAADRARCIGSTPTTLEDARNSLMEIS